MSDQQVVTRFNFDDIASGLVRMVNEIKLTEKFWTHIDPDFFFNGDKTARVRAFREILKEFKKICLNDGPSFVTRTYLGSRLGYSLIEDKDEVVSLYNSIFADEEIRQKSVDEGTFGIFLDYLKVIHLLKWSKPFMSDYREGNIQAAINSMRELVPIIDRIKLGEEFVFDPDTIEQYLADDVNSVNKNLFLGSPTLDEGIGGFESQTLNLFISVTGGGKTMMTHHLLRRAIIQKMTVHVAVVEDRPKSFSRRLVAALTGISIKRLKTQFHQLSSIELNEIHMAKQLIKKYIKVEFIYGESVDSVHKRKLDYDAERKRLGEEPCQIDIVDYTGHIAKYSPGSKPYEKMLAAFSARKDFALKYNKIAFDSAQINREGLHRLEDETHSLTHGDLAGGFDLSSVCDNIISINRTTRQKEEQKATLHLSKGRDSHAGLTVKITTDFGRAQWKMEDEIANMMNAGRREDLMGKAVNEVVSGESNL